MREFQSESLDARLIEKPPTGYRSGQDGSIADEERAISGRRAGGKSFNERRMLVGDFGRGWIAVKPNGPHDDTDNVCRSRASDRNGEERLRPTQRARSVARSASDLAVSQPAIVGASSVSCTSTAIVFGIARPGTRTL